MIREYRHMWYFFFDKISERTEPDSLFPKKSRWPYARYNPLDRERKIVYGANKHLTRERWIRGFDFRSLLK